MIAFNSLENIVDVMWINRFKDMERTGGEHQLKRMTFHKNKLYDVGLYSAYKNVLMEFTYSMQKPIKKEIEEVYMSVNVELLDSSERNDSPTPTSEPVSIRKFVEVP